MTSAAPNPSVTVGVVALCGPRHIERCLRALEAQSEAPAFDVVVAHNAALAGVSALGERFPAARFVCREGFQTPIDLAALAASKAAGEILLLTEDHCVPEPEWVRRLSAALEPGRAAVGGGIETDAKTATSWAFYFVDFFRYLEPVPAGEAVSVSVCNVAYRRAELEGIRECWERGFHETEVHEQLRQRFGALWLVAGAAVKMRREVRFGDAVRERYDLGRLFAAKRAGFSGRGRRVFYLLFSPGLPVLLLGRMAGKALRRADTAGKFLQALAALVALVVAWSWGEFLGYLTGRAPAAVRFAEEIETAEEHR
ncbi:MAG: hypothetical protein HY234_01310 [Acidobacteria bacterium]|nr:hypothetical protein [Acidobacteriota bacterium]